MSTPFKYLIGALSVLVLIFIKPLFELGRLALAEDLYSHTLLIPFISAYLIWINRTTLPTTNLRNSKIGMLLVVAAVPLLAFYLFGTATVFVDRLSAGIAAFVLSVLGVIITLLGPAFFRSIAFPVIFLVFMIPFPVAVEHAIEMFFQHTSADAASVLFDLSPVPVLRDGLIFKIPGIVIQVAEECSGIRSSLVLFITSLVAGYLFLKSPGKRAFLAFLVIPLGIIRNGFRILTIGYLCSEYGPHMIHSWIHHRGGPVFFLLSLIPFFLVLIILIKLEKNKAGMKLPASEAIKTSI